MPRTVAGPGQVNEDTLQDADNNTKVQVEKSPNENKIRFDTAGSERMIIDSIGRVGIGTASPSDILHIQGSASTTRLQIENTAVDGDPMLMLQTDGVTNWYIGIDDSDADKLMFMSDGGAWDPTSAEVTFTTDGKVGIGTTSPAKKLDVVGDIKASDSLYVDKIRRATDNGTVTKIEFESLQLQFYAGGNASNQICTMSSAGLKVDGSFAGAYTSYNADDFIATGSHFIIDWTGTSSSTNTTLPTPNNIAGRIYHILNTSSSDQSNLTVNTVLGINFIGSNIENGSSTTVILGGGGPQSITVVSTHAAWFVLHDGRFPPNDP